MRCWILAMACVLLGCRARAPLQAPAICALPLPRAHADAPPQALPAESWFTLLFKGYRGGIPQDAVDCTGAAIATPDMPSGCREAEPASLLVARRSQLGAEQLVLRHADGDYWFGWAPYKVYADGMREGPLAIARNHDGKLEVRAAGTLRSYPDQLQLEVRRVAGQHLLIAEGEHCTKPGRCQRALRVMWLDRQRFHERPVRGASERECLGPAWFPRHEQVEVSLGKHLRRSLERELALAFDEDALVIDEHIRVRDRDLTRPTLPPRAFRDASAQMRISLEGGELLSEGRSLWRSIRIEDGATRGAPVEPSAPHGQ